MVLLGQTGYHLDNSFNLNTADEEIAHDMCNTGTPKTAIGFIVEALRRRHDREADLLSVGAQQVIERMHDLIWLL